MPSMANISVKAVDGTTLVVYDALSASAGSDTSPAVWRADTGVNSAIPIGLRKIFSLWSKWNGPKTARQLKFTYVGPYRVLDSTTGQYSVKEKMVAEGIITVPQGMPLLEIQTFSNEFLNLMASDLIKASVQAGYAPT